MPFGPSPVAALEGLPITDRPRPTPTTTPCSDGDCHRPAITVGLCTNHAATRITAAGVIRRRARTLLDLIDTDRNLSDPHILTGWIRSVQDAAYELDRALKATP